MRATLAIGVGCRAGCASAVIAALVTRARAEVDPEAPATLFSIEQKQDEPGLREAAASLGLALVFLPHDDVAAVAARVLTASPASRARFDLPSVSEAAALAGAGPGAKLLLLRIAQGGATCAVAGRAKGMA